MSDLYRAGPRGGLVHIALESKALCGAAVLLGSWGRTESPVSCPRCIAVAEEAKAAQEVAINRTRWESGNLAHLLDPTQRKIRALREQAWARLSAPATTQAEMLKRASTPIGFYELASRETGKSHEFLVLAQEVCRQIPNALVVIVRGRRDDAEKVARDLMPRVEETCPEDLKLVWAPGDGEYRNKANGAAIRFRGTESEQRGRLRGFGFNLGIIDECAEIDELRAVLAIVEPLVLRLNGRLVLATTPAEVQGHESESVYEEFLHRGASCMFTLLDNGRLSWEEKAKRLLGGTEPESVDDVPAILAGEKHCKKTKNRREWFCEFVSEASQLVHPAWTEHGDELTVKIERAA